MRICNFNASPTCRSTATPSRRSRPSSTLLPSHSRPLLLLLGPFTSPSPPMERYNAPRQPSLRATTQSARQRYPPFFLPFFLSSSSSSFFPFSSLNSPSPPPISLSLFFFLLLLYAAFGHCGDRIELLGWFCWGRGR